jgi:hypothetical protein
MVNGADLLQSQLDLVAKLNREALLAKDQLTGVLGPTQKDLFPVDLEVLPFEVEGTKFRATMTPGQFMRILKKVNNHAPLNDVIEEVGEILSDLDTGAVDAMMAIVEAMGVQVARRLDHCATGLGCCTCSDGSLVHCISQCQCLTLYHSTNWKAGGCSFSGAHHHVETRERPDGQEGEPSRRTPQAGSGGHQPAAPSHEHPAGHGNPSAQ